MAAKLESNLGASTELIEGSGGIFDVRIDDRLVYSKFETGEFPDEDALVGELATQ
ncbi:MAG: SelT/SelW/SelH family protein [Gammaproteobacteria bacterium]|nr:SelT/SelW/SelH family protein [Gammaproteobacteria bacterium]